MNDQQTNQFIEKTTAGRFEDLVAWKKARKLSIEIYEAFRTSKDYGFRDQIQRASVSVMNNIAEGYERGTQKELRQFLFIAKGSCGEVRSMLNLAKGLAYIDSATYQQLNPQAIETSQVIAAFIKSLNVNRSPLIEMAKP